MPDVPALAAPAGHVASAGPGGSWKIFSAINKKPGVHLAKVQASVSSSCKGGWAVGNYRYVHVQLCAGSAPLSVCERTGRQDSTS